MRTNALRTLAVVLSLGLTGSALVACGTVTGSDEKPIVIGASVEQTGRAADLGRGWYNALKLVEDQINDEGGALGRPIKVDIRDNKSEPQEAVRIAQDFAGDEEVVAHVGPGLSGSTIGPDLDKDPGVIPIVEKAGLPTVAMASATPITPPGKPYKYVYKTSPTTLQDAKIIIDRLKQDNVKTVGILVSDDAYGAAGAKDVEDTARQTGIAASTEKFPLKAPTKAELTAAIDKIATQKPQAIIVYCIWPVAKDVANLIATKGLAQKTYFSTGAGADLFTKGVGAAAEGVYMSHPEILAMDHTTATSPADLKRKDFFADYSQRYGTYSGFASYSADALQLVVEAIKKAKSTDRNKIRDALETLEYDGLTGNFRMSPTDHHGLDDDSMTVMTVRNGGWVLAQ